MYYGIDFESTPYMMLVRQGRELHQQELEYKMWAEKKQRDKLSKKHHGCVIERRSR